MSMSHPEAPAKTLTVTHRPEVPPPRLGGNFTAMIDGHAEGELASLNEEIASLQEKLVRAVLRRAEVSLHHTLHLRFDALRPAPGGKP